MGSDDVQAVKERLDIVDIVGRYVDLRQVAGRWVAPCPFHQETKPSFSVNQESGFFYCFGCQAAGDVIDFYMRINGLEFRDALEQLALEAGVELRGYKPDPNRGQKVRQKKIVLKAQQLANSYFQNNLNMPDAREVWQYLDNRGLNQEIIRKFQLGYSFDSWRGLKNFLASKGLDDNTGVLAGLFSKNEKGNIYDRFRGRLMFPIMDLASKVVAFGGRIIKQDDNAAKYINSSDTPVYKKGEHLYGLNQARGEINKSKRVLLTEGYMDVLSLHQFGFVNACGVLGTALTNIQVKRLSGFASRVELVFDGDNAGRKAALRSAEMILSQGVDCRVVNLPDGEDVDSLLQAHGAKAFDGLLSNAAEGLEFCMRYLRDNHSPKEIMAWLDKFLSGLSDVSLRAFYIPRLAAGLGLSEAELRGSGVAGKTPVKKQVRAVPGENPPVQNEQTRDDKYYIGFAIRHPWLVEHLEAQGIRGVLSSRWGHGFWERLVLSGVDGALQYLDPRDKSFWAGCRVMPPMEGAKLDREWGFILSRIDKAKTKAGRSELKALVRQAQAAGDTERMLAYLKELNDSFGRNDEQY